MKTILGTCENGMKCVFDLPFPVDSVEDFEKLITGTHYSDFMREELQGQPKLAGLAGPMFNGYKTLKATGEIVAVIRYEDHRREVYND